MKKILLAIACTLFTFNLMAQGLPTTQIKDVSTGKKTPFDQTIEKGKVTLISFWATWCVPCKKEINNLSEVMPEWTKSMDFDLVAISIDDTRNQAKVKSYVNGQKWDFRTYMDPNQDLKRLLNFQTIPYTIVYDKDGRVAYTHTGYVEGDETILREKIRELLAVK